MLPKKSMLAPQAKSKETDVLRATQNLTSELHTSVFSLLFKYYLKSISVHRNSTKPNLNHSTCRGADRRLVILYSFWKYFQKYIYNNLFKILIFYHGVVFQSYTNFITEPHSLSNLKQSLLFLSSLMGAGPRFLIKQYTLKNEV